MSLLLDALKKASDDKKKNINSEALPEIDADVSQTRDTADAQDASLHVELEDQPLDLELHEPPDDSEAPQLDETALDESAFTEDDEPSIDIDLDETLEAEDNNLQSPTETSLATPSASLPEKPEPVKDTTDDINTDDINDVAEAASIDITPPDNTETLAESSAESTTSEVVKQVLPETTPEISERQAEKNTRENKIKNERALSALINKSNHHSQKEKKRQLITVSLLVVLILIGSGIYFYLQMQTSSTDLYTAENSKEVIHRNPEINNRNNTSPVKTDEASAINKIKPSDTTVSQQGQQTDKALQDRSIVNKLQDNQLQDNKFIESQLKPAISKQQTLATAINKQARSDISIVRSQKPDPVHTLLSQAYEQFNQGNYPAAETLYNRVLQREPKNRDALLGVSAIAVKQNRYELARQKYQYLLKLNPRDSIATAGLSSIKNLMNPQLNESQIKFLLSQQPDAAHLYFALGNIYSKQNKWAQAQSAYFSAWSAKNKNADYAYNLAVSLDRLNKKNQALDFYKLSLKLMPETNSNFSSQAAMKRISLLQGIVQ